MKRVLVCGGRDYTNVKHVRRVLARIEVEHDSLIIIEGGAVGVDACASEWAHHRGFENLTFHADWKKHGRAAGPIRNQQMLDEGKPDLVVAFPGGTGTADMVRRARAAGVPVIEAKP